MKILLTNDDGIAAPGLWAAARALVKLGQVTIVAPAVNHSGYGAALSPTRRVSCFPYRHPDGHPENVAAYGVVATPATCVHVGLGGALGGPFDLVVSGINHGANLGRDVFYSGTVGAALTAHLLGVPAIAISLAVGPGEMAHWETAAWALGETVRLWQATASGALSAGSSPPTLFNINVPNRPLSHLADILVTMPASTSCLTRYRFHVDPQAGDIVVSPSQDDPPAPEPGTDAWAVEMGYVSITPLRAFPNILDVVPGDFSPKYLRLSLPSPVEVEHVFVD
ncbi:MAG: 5'/3'-nucleotidase SurE [Chloroflexi bacterium]|jgi:5'-nucleotidase|nr:5'/3'-nucleotidase SurE [Chloroflexota bacterium]